MRASVLAFLSAAAITANATPITPATIIVEKAGPNGFENTTIEVSPEHDFDDPAFLSEVTSLYELDTEYFCFAYKPDGDFYDDEYFGIDKPLHISDTNVVVAAVTCRIE